MKRKFLLTLVIFASAAQAQNNVPEKTSFNGTLSDDITHCYTNKQKTLAVDRSIGSLYCIDFNAEKDIWDFMPGEPGKHNWYFRVANNLLTAYLWEWEWLWEAVSPRYSTLTPIPVSEVKQRFPHLFKPAPKDSKNKKDLKLPAPLSSFTIESRKGDAKACLDASYSQTHRNYAIVRKDCNAIELSYFAMCEWDSGKGTHTTHPSMFISNAIIVSPSPESFGGDKVDYGFLRVKNEIQYIRRIFNCAPDSVKYAACRENYELILLKINDGPDRVPRYHCARTK